jgi:hypothetical protein
MKYKICYIDDLYYWIAQVINSIPKNIDYEFYYFNRIKDIEFQKYDIVILDYYLDKDGVTSEVLINKFEWSNIISFSSEKNKNTYMLSKWANYVVTKLSETNINYKLAKILTKICNE